MCDITPTERRKRYKALKKVGHTTAWARRARDFNESHYNYHKDNVPTTDNYKYN